MKPDGSECGSCHQPRQDWRAAPGHLPRRQGPQARGASRGARQKAHRCGGPSCPAPSSPSVAGCHLALGRACLKAPHLTGCLAAVHGRGLASRAPRPEPGCLTRRDGKPVHIASDGTQQQGLAPLRGAHLPAPLTTPRRTGPRFPSSTPSGRRPRQAAPAPAAWSPVPDKPAAGHSGKGQCGRAARVY